MGSVKLSAGHWKSLWRDKWKAHTCSKRQVGQCGERVNIWFGGDTEQAKQILLFCNYVLRSGASFLCRGRAGFGSARTLPCINDSLGSGCSAQHISPAGESESWGFWFGVIWRVKTRHPPPLQLPPPPSELGNWGEEVWVVRFWGFFFFLWPERFGISIWWRKSDEKGIYSATSACGSAVLLCHEAQRCCRALFVHSWLLLSTDTWVCIEY